MNRPDRDAVLFSLRERENRTGHFTSCSRTGRTGLEQVEQVTVPLMRTYSRRWNRSMEKGPFFGVVFKRAVLTALEQVKKRTKGIYLRILKMLSAISLSFPTGEGESAKYDYVNSFLGENTFIYSMGYYLKTLSHLRPKLSQEIGRYIPLLPIYWGPYPIPLLWF